MISQHRTDRATAYNHMPPHERAASFIKSSIYFCEQNIGGLQSEIKMWGEPEIVALLGDETCYMKRCQAESALKEHEAEKQSWEHLYDKLGACQTCNGQGWLWQCVSQDESIKVKCDSCGGLGKTLAATAAVKTVEAQKAVAAAEAAKKPTLLDNMKTALGRKFR
jgi:hypothetical protein